MTNQDLNKYRVKLLDENTLKSSNGGESFFYWLGCQFAEMINNYDPDRIKAVNSPITGPNGNKYM